MATDGKQSPTWLLDIGECWPSSHDQISALAGLGRCGLKEHTLGLAPESLSWGRGALAVVCPAPKGAGLRFWLAPLGTEKRGGGERGGDQGVGDRGGTERSGMLLC